MRSHQVTDEMQPANEIRYGASGVPLVSEDESRLIEGCRRKERDSQRRLYELHCERVYRLMRRMVGPSDADDLTQHVFLCVLQKIDRFHGRSSFSTWLYRLATNEALQFLRRSRRQENQSILYDPIDTHDKLDAQMEHHEMLGVALARLDPELRVILLLREIEEMAYCDIANTLDIAQGTVASRLHRARHCLRELIEEACR